MVYIVLLVSSNSFAGCLFKYRIGGPLLYFYVYDIRGAIIRYLKK